MLKIEDLSSLPILENNSMRLKPIMCHESYTLFKRLGDGSYIIAFLVNMTDEQKCSWSQGYYIQDYTDAIKLFFEKIGIKLERR